jgi:hypothetical protein
MSTVLWCLAGFLLGFAFVAVTVTVQFTRRRNMGIPGKTLGSFSGVFNASTGGGGSSGNLTMSVNGNPVIAMSRREASAEVSLWADLAERTDASLTSPTPDYDAIDQVLKSVGIEHGSMMDPIALMHAMPKSMTVHLSSLPDFPGMIRVSVHESGSQQSSRRVDTATHGIAACLAELEFIKASSRVNGVAQGLRGVSYGGIGLDNQHLRQMINQQMINHKAQQQAVQQLGGLGLCGQVKPPGNK